MAISGYATISRTVAELISATEEHLGKNRHQLNRLNAAITTVGQATATMEFELGAIRNGAYLEIDDEVLFVWSVAGQVATVERGALGTTPATHLTASLVRVNPRFFRYQILKALREDINSWPRSVFPVIKGEYDLAINVSSIDLAGIPAGAQSLRLLKVWRQQTGTTYSPQRWPGIPGVMLEPAANLDTFASGYRLVWPSQHTAGTYQVAIGGPFVTSTFVSATDLGTIGLTVPMIDIPPLGAAARLMLPQETQRANPAAIGRSRLADEVPPGHISQTAQELLAWRDRRLDDEAKRLLNDYGWTEG